MREPTVCEQYVWPISGVKPFVRSLGANCKGVSLTLLDTFKRVRRGTKDTRDTHGNKRMRLPGSATYLDHALNGTICDAAACSPTVALRTAVALSLPRTPVCYPILFKFFTASWMTLKEL